MDNCTLCDSKIEQDNGDIVGCFGITPIAFCVWCLSSMKSMIENVYNLNDIETLEQRIEDLKSDM